MIRIYKSENMDWLSDELWKYNLIDVSYMEFNRDKLERIVSEYFNGKCSYCENSMEFVEVQIDYYRPVNGALNTVDGMFREELYTWLKTDINNLFSICVECNRAKSNRFPVEGEVAAFNASKHELLKEKRLLLNPYRDYPERHFSYSNDGKIYPRTKKGQFTIDVLNLNRASLIEARRIEYIRFEDLCKNYIDSRHGWYIEDIAKEISQESKFTGLKRYILSDLILRGSMEYTEELNESLKGLMTKSEWIYLISNNSNKFIEPRKRKYYDIEKKINHYHVADNEDIPKYFIKQRLIEKIEINNFKIIQDLKIDLTLSKSKDAPWLMLLGENGIGKSTILQAIALALMGERERETIMWQINKDASEYVRHGANQGYIKVHLSGMFEPISLYFNKEWPQFKGRNHQEQRVLLLAYGSTRLLPRNNMEVDPTVTWARIGNLFNPFIPLVHVKEYLLSLNDEDFFNVGRAIKLIMLEDVKIFRDRSKERLFFKLHNSTVELEELSDGYQTVIALATDIMMVMKNRWRSFDAEGIVLIDEIDAHLHPRWNIEIVTRLKKAFPKIQFIATSHNPLSLRGLIDGEVAVLLEDEDKEPYVIQNLPSQEEFNVETLLTSKFFGLYDTMPELNKLFNRYYLLLSNPNRDIDEEVEVQDLKRKLSKYEKVGTTLREQKFYELVDSYIANSKMTNSNKTNEDFKDVIKQAIQYFER
ncbi:AAA family ATPase [Bacillus toyonensis]|uniref:AAA family ATPase n=1 Tax=Bacillus cereus group TaxID=86661 RepID=UPI0010BD82B0|nr:MULTISPECIES: AAA family ATPase [Bacillus cereus group]MCU5582503.1 AAA family ATPase [Bacillus toyonensis]TKH75981.1 chromosome segregation protein SMC [Bacillus cereus]